MKICIFGAHDPTYARNQFLRAALAAVGVETVACNVPLTMPTRRKYPRLIAQYVRVWRDCDLIWVPEFQQSTVPLASLLGRLTGRRVVFDQVIAMYEAVVLERHDHPAGSRAARRYWWLDRVAMALADRVLTATGPYRDFLIDTFQADPDKIIVAPLGVDPTVFRPLPAPPPPPDGVVQVVYFGAYVPNHGTDIMIRAAKLLEDRGARFRLTMVGGGSDKQAAVALAAELGTQTVDFVDWVQPERLADYVKDAHIVLGVFGKGGQADHAMANKVLQGLAMRRAVISGDTAATAENFVHSEHLWLVAPGDAQALATGLQRLFVDAELRHQLALEGHLRLHKRLAPAKVGGDLLAALTPLLRRPPRA